MKLSENQVKIEEAQEVTVEPPKPDKMSFDEEKLFQHHENLQNARLGWIGRFLGAKKEKPGNVSGSSLFISKKKQIKTEQQWC